MPNNPPSKPVQPLTVADLIAHLQTLPPHLLVGYQIYSEQLLLEPSDLKIEDHCPPRLDGWIQSKRPDMPTQSYLMLPGN